MEFSGELALDKPPEELWAYFTDPDILAECAPGCKELTQRNESELDAVLSVGVGSVKPTFDVDVTVTRADHPELLEMKVSGADARNAFEAAAEMTLADDGDGGTEAAWVATANVSGLLASLGQRALGSVTNKLANDFFDDLEAKANDGVPAECRLEAAPNADATIE